MLLGERMCTMAELLLFEAARAEHIENVIAPALHRGVHVIYDRFDASTYAYQVRARWNRKHEKFFEILNAEVIGKTKPDLYLFCDVRAEKALARRMADDGKKSRFDLEEKEFHEHVYLGYKQFFANLLGSRRVAIDATTDIETMINAAETIVRSELMIE